jgi:ATP-dependent Clp protease ATP-binding subunit ClpB
LTNIKENREKIDRLKQEAIVYEREWNLWEVARIRYWEILELEKRIEEDETKMKELQDSGTSYLKERVESNDIAEIVAKWTWIPAQKLLETEKEKLLKLEEILKTQVIGQDMAIEAISNAIRRARAWLAEEWKPAWSFLFLWPTWVWKTETAKALARELFNDEKNMIIIDMSEYMEKHSVSRLIWAPPWYIGYEEWGQLTEAVRRKPYSVLLFDEIEKAHPDVFNILLQVLDDGRLTDGKGRVVNFSNTIIILTSNIAGQKIQEMTEKWKEIYEIYVSVEEDLRKYFKPEFLNRLDDIIIFNSLKESDILKIVDIVLTDFLNLLASKKINAKVSLTLKAYLANTWYDKDFWARPLKRLITKKLINPLSSMIISWELVAWDKVEIDLGKNKEIVVNKLKV